MLYLAVVTTYLKSAPTLVLAALLATSSLLPPSIGMAETPHFRVTATHTIGSPGESHFFRVQPILLEGDQILIPAQPDRGLAASEVLNARGEIVASFQVPGAKFFQPLPNGKILVTSGTGEVRLLSYSGQELAKLELRGTVRISPTLMDGGRIGVVTEFEETYEDGSSHRFGAFSVLEVKSEQLHVLVQSGGFSSTISAAPLALTSSHYLVPFRNGQVQILRVSANGTGASNAYFSERGQFVVSGEPTSLRRLSGNRILIHSSFNQSSGCVGSSSEVFSWADLTPLITATDLSWGNRPTLQIYSIQGSDSLSTIVWELPGTDVRLFTSTSLMTFDEDGQRLSTQRFGSDVLPGGLAVSAVAPITPEVAAISRDDDRAGLVLVEVVSGRLLHVVRGVNAARSAAVSAGNGRLVIPSWTRGGLSLVSIQGEVLDRFRAGSSSFYYSPDVLSDGTLVAEDDYGIVYWLRIDE